MDCESSYEIWFLARSKADCKNPIDFTEINRRKGCGCDNRY